MVKMYLRSNKKTKKVFFLFCSPFCYQGGCIVKLENFIMDHLKLIGAVGVGVACVQVRDLFIYLLVLIQQSMQDAGNKGQGANRHFIT